jgi:hypothetical protein
VFAYNCELNFELGKIIKKIRFEFYLSLKIHTSKKLRKMKKISLLVLPVLISCNTICPEKKENEQNIITETEDYSTLKTIDAINAPNGYERKTTPDDSFGSFLRGLKLSNNNTVYLFDGTKKDYQNQYAVIAIPLDGELEQCADFVMKLRMLYLKTQSKDMVFYDNEDGVYKLSYPYNNFNNYKQRVFGMCGTMSLSKHLLPRDMKEIAIGDVFIKGGFPGHVQIVIDVVEDTEGHKLFMLAEGYTPAQSPHIVKNINDESPWFSNEENTIASTGYTFTSDQLMTW